MDAKITLASLSKLTEDEARTYLEKIRWPDGPFCPRQGCGSTEVTKLQGKSTRPGVYKCRTCRKPFTVSIGTIWERSHIPLRLWVMAFHVMCSSKKGVSALQLKRQLGLGSYESAWFMCHRVRYAMCQEPLAGMLKGVVEVDETWVGGKPRNPDLQNRADRKREKWSSKTPVVVALERDGNAISFPVKRVTARTLRSAVNLLVEPGSVVNTDENLSYRRLGTSGYDHRTVNHSAREYLRGADHINNAESYFALLKRGIHGSFHHVSVKHLPRYCSEFSFRWNGRKLIDGDRTLAALRAVEGKRLVYKDLAGNEEARSARA